MFEYYGDIHVYCPGVAAYEPLDGRTPDHGHPISLLYEPNGSGELKIGIPLHTPVLFSSPEPTAHKVSL